MTPTATPSSPTTPATIPAAPAPTAPAMTPSTASDDLSPRLAAKIAGVGYIALFVLGIFANFFVREALVVTDDAAATAANITDSEGLFRAGLASFMAIFLIDVVVAWALYILFRNANRDLSLVAAWFRLVYTVFLGVALIFFFQALQLLSGADFLASIDEQQLNAQALVAVDTFNSAWLIGLMGFGLHLIALGYLIIKTGAAPRLLGAVLSVAGTAYVLDTVAHGLLFDYADYATLLTVMVAVPSIVAEGWFGLWLLFRGGTDRTAAPAV